MFQNPWDVLIVKRGDRFATTWSVPISLVGSSVRLIARKRFGDPIILPSTIIDAPNGHVQHILDGTLTVGNYRVELEITRGTEIITAPSSSYENLRVIPDLG